jgi:hypothetical protein
LSRLFGKFLKVFFGCFAWLGLNGKRCALSFAEAPQLQATLFFFFSLPCILIISKIFNFFNIQIAQNYGIFFVQFDGEKVLDKFSRVWYNGKFGPVAGEKRPQLGRQKEKAPPGGAYPYSHKAFCIAL